MDANNLKICSCQLKTFRQLPSLVFVLFQKDDCAARCLSIPACTHYVWKQLDFGTCFFKNGTVIKMEAFPDKASRSSICGVLPLSSDTDSGSFCRFTGKELGKVMVPQEQCVDACRKADGCTHYVWTESNEGTCSLIFNATASMSQAIRTRRFSICGLVREKFSVKAFQKFRWNEDTNSATGCDVIGSNLRAELTTLQDCPTRCLQISECRHYVW